ncbi:MAG: DUF3843 family protein [Bacteroidales bacterium]|nr:DUF3843 family protein [Bacteroidales bacterium]
MKQAGNRTIYLKDWMNVHPEIKQSNSDLYYIQLSNRILNAIEVILPSELFVLEEAKEISVHVAAWFEDIISGLHIWDSFTHTCQALYGKRLPFPTIDEADYFEGEVNQADLEFLIWHLLQRFHGNENDIMINPQDPGIRFMAQGITKLLEEEYETAPESTTMQEYLDPRKYDDYYTFTRNAEWLYFFSYLHGPSNEERLNGLYEEMKEIQDQYTKEELARIFYDARNQMLFSSHGGPLACTVSEWMAAMYEETPWVKELLDGVAVRERAWYFVEEKTPIHLTLVAKEGGETIKALCKSVSMETLKSILPGKSNISVACVRYHDEWWFNGSILLDNKKENPSEIKPAAEETPAMEHKDYVAFMKATNNYDLAYIESYETLKSFLVDSLGWADNEDETLPTLKDNENFVLYANKDKGLLIAPDICSLVKDPANPYYNAEEAAEEATMLYFIPGLCPIDLLQRLERDNLIPDTGFQPLDDTSKEEAKVLFQENKDFFARYFLTDYYFGE